MPSRLNGKQNNTISKCSRGANVAARQAMIKRYESIRVKQGGMIQLYTHSVYYSMIAIQPAYLAY